MGRRLKARLLSDLNPDYQPLFGAAFFIFLPSIWLYNSSVPMVCDPVQPADLIFVIAGRIERKKYGLQLYRSGYAPRLLLSVGRFEVSKMRGLDSGLGLEFSSRLETLRDQSAPEERHFFVLMESSATRIERIRLRRWSTYGEALGLRDFLEGKSFKRVLVVSSAMHLRRVAFSFSRVFRSSPIEFLYCSVPAELDSFGQERWWTRPADRSQVLTEGLKMAGYWIILHLPGWAVRKLMRLKD